MKSATSYPEFWVINLVYYDYIPISSPNAHNMQDAYWSGYGKTSIPFWCPETREPAKNSTTGKPIYLCSYAGMARLQSYQVGDLYRVIQPSRRYLFLDARVRVGTLNYPTQELWLSLNKTAEHQNWRHNNGVNILYCDMHAGYQTYQKTVNDSYGFSEDGTASAYRFDPEKLP